MNQRLVLRLLSLALVSLPLGVRMSSETRRSAHRWTRILPATSITCA
jgi:hypothetical protein